MCRKWEGLTGIFSSSCLSASLLLVRVSRSSCSRRERRPPTALACLLGLSGEESSTTRPFTSSGYLHTHYEHTHMHTLTHTHSCTYLIAVNMAEAPPILCPTRTVLVTSLSFRNCTVSLDMWVKVISGEWGLSPWFLVSNTYTFISVHVN